MTRFIISPFHRTLPRSSAFVNCISVRFYETGCISIILDKMQSFIILLISLASIAAGKTKTAQTPFQVTARAATRSKHKNEIWCHIMEKKKLYMGKFIQIWEIWYCSLVQPCSFFRHQGKCRKPLKGSWAKLETFIFMHFYIFS